MIFFSFYCKQLWNKTNFKYIFNANAKEFPDEIFTHGSCKDLKIGTFGHTEENIQLKRFNKTRRHSGVLRDKALKINWKTKGKWNHPMEVLGNMDYLKYPFVQFFSHCAVVPLCLDELDLVSQNYPKGYQSNLGNT